MSIKVAVVGFEEASRDYFEDRLRTDEVHFVNAISRDECIIHDPDYPFEERLEAGHTRMEDADVHAVITYWDFPASMLTAFLAEREGTPYASTSAVLKCEHKYWFRQEQAKVVDTPAFASFNPFADDPLSEIGMDYPFWVKPVVGHSSMLGFEIKNEDDFKKALAEIREGIEQMTRPFRYAIEHVDMPQELKDKGTCLCMAEEIISKGEQYTLEGYVRNGKVFVYGVFASVRHPNGHTFSRYQYPAKLEQAIVDRMIETTEKIIGQIGFDGSPFNIEFFHDEDADRLHVVEINSRLSQSHSDLFYKVDGQTHQQIAVNLALDEEPQWKRGEGEFNVAGKCFLRYFEDAVVTRVPTEADIAKVKAEMPDVRVDSNVGEGTRLSELEEQESYSYEVADIFIGADSEEGLLRKFDRAVELLNYQFEPV